MNFKTVALVMFILIMLFIFHPVLASGGQQHGEVGQGNVHQVVPTPGWQINP